MSDFSLPSLREEVRQALPPGHTYSKQIDRALVLAFQAHDGQVRLQRDSNAPRIPYIVHPVGVAKVAAEMWVDGELADNFDDVVSAALTHDVLEDSTIDLLELASLTSKRAADIVLALTKPRVTSALPREERSKALAEQILNAGTTAGYVKLCDIVHNLNRPSIMPYPLLEKTIRKASRHYLPLAAGQPFEERFAARLRVLIADAEATARERVNHRFDFASRGFDHFLGYCIKQSRGKILEVHDIIETLCCIPGVACCSISGISDFLDAYSGSLLAGNKDSVQAFRAGKWMETGEVPLLKPVFHHVGSREMRIDRIHISPLNTVFGADDVIYVFAGVSDALKPAWLSPRTLSATVSLLSERLRARESRELAEYAEALGHFGLNLDPRLARKHALSQQEMLVLKNQQEAGQFVHGNLRYAIEHMIRSSGIETVVDRIESRVKTPASTLRKIDVRKLVGQAGIDDLVGVRVIFASRKGSSRFVSIFQRGLSCPDSGLLSLVQAQVNSVSVDEIKSTAGYQATHIRFLVKAPGPALQFVPCEVQLRTLLEDAWARLSQISSYKKHGASRSRKVALLKDLAELRDQYEERISREI